MNLIEFISPFRFATPTFPFFYLISFSRQVRISTVPWMSLNKCILSATVWFGNGISLLNVRGEYTDLSGKLFCATKHSFRIHPIFVHLPVSEALRSKPCLYVNGVKRSCPINK